MSTIFSIGHSNRSIDTFIAILQSFEIDTLADVRSVPVSGYCPQFNKVEFSASLQRSGISYLHIPQLGGKREGGFRPYMGTPEFEVAIARLEAAAHGKCLAYMCAEADWMHCHRSLISGYLFKKEWKVVHIKGVSLSETHITRMQQGKLF